MYKEKILEALKTKYANLGFGQKTLDGIAAILAESVADESQIETAVGGVEPFLKVFQADADRARTEYKAMKSLHDKLKAQVEASSVNGGGQSHKNEPDEESFIIREKISCSFSSIQVKFKNRQAL